MSRAHHVVVDRNETRLFDFRNRYLFGNYGGRRDRRRRRRRRELELEPTVD